MLPVSLPDLHSIQQFPSTAPHVGLWLSISTPRGDEPFCGNSLVNLFSLSEIYSCCSLLRKGQTILYAFNEVLWKLKTYIVRDSKKKGTKGEGWFEGRWCPVWRPPKTAQAITTVTTVLGCYKNSVAPVLSRRRSSQCLGQPSGASLRLGRKIGGLPVRRTMTNWAEIHTFQAEPGDRSDLRLVPVPAYVCVKSRCLSVPSAAHLARLSLWVPLRRIACGEKHTFFAELLRFSCRRLKVNRERQ